MAQTGPCNHYRPDESVWKTDAEGRKLCLCGWTYEKHEPPETLEKKQYQRGFSDARAGHSPSLLKGPYMEGYIAGRSG